VLEEKVKTIIAGSRTIADYALVAAACRDCGWTITEVVCGCARGVDTLGELWAKRNGVPVRYFPANWALYGKSAGFIRNGEMIDYADALIAVWDGESRGTNHTIQEARKRGLSVYVVNAST